MNQPTQQARKAVAKQLVKALREIDKVSFVGAGMPEFDGPRRKILESIDSLGYTVKDDPWKLYPKD